VPQRYQEIEGNSSGETKSLMVDQLWIWVLGPSLIVTSFPQDWQYPCTELPDLLSNILEETDSCNGTPPQSVYDLATCIGGQCLSSCDQNTHVTNQETRTSILEMFGTSVSDVMDQEAFLFSKWKEAMIVASM
jgi:hypothetical protein